MSLFKKEPEQTWDIYNVEEDERMVQEEKEEEQYHEMASFVIETGMTVAEERRMNTKLAKRRTQMDRAVNQSYAYYALNAHPSYTMFGHPDFVDDKGRYYRLAFTIRGMNQSPLITQLLRMRASRIDMIDATMDDLLKVVILEAKHPVVLDAVVPSNARVRIWVRTPKTAPKRREGAGPWPTAGEKLELEYVGDSSLAEPGEKLTVSAMVVNSQRGGADRATGYIDVIDLEHWVCERLLARKIARLSAHTTSNK